MRQLRLPGASCVTPFVSVAPQYLRSISSFRSPVRGNRRADARVLFNRSHPLLFRCFRPKDAFGSPKFPANPSCICPALRLRPGLHARLSSGASVLPPHIKTSKAPAIHALSKLNHTAFALAVYASCRPLGRRRKTRFRWLAKPFRVGFLMPTEFVRRVSALASPLPGFILARLAPALDLALTQSRARAGARARGRARGRAADRELHLRIISATKE